MADDMEKRAQKVAEDVCQRAWHEITPDHPISVREIKDVIFAFARRVRAETAEECAKIADEYVGGEVVSMAIRQKFPKESA